MNLDLHSVTSFSPIDPDLYEITFKGEVESWTLPVIGFSTVITYAVKHDEDLADSRLAPVLLDDEGTPIPVWEYLRNWDENTPTWTMQRKPQTRQAPCPACGLDATYATTVDRYFHNDGSLNTGCWLRLVRGEV